MKTWLLAIVAVTSLAIIAAPAKARPHGGIASGAPAGTCLQATDNGCAAANQNGSFQSASLLVSAQQNGQNSLLPTRAGGALTLNIPGVDYPIGPDKTLTPQDPRNIVWSATTPCAYIGTGANAPPNDFVGCYTAGTYPNAVLGNYDFSGAKIGKAPLTLYMNSDALAGSKITLTNDYFYIPAGDSKAIGWGLPSGGNWSIVFKNSQCDGSIATTSSQFCFGDDGDLAGTSFDAEYSVFTNQGVGRVSGGMRYMSYTFKYNFVQGLNDLLTANHGEVDLRTCSQNGCNPALTRQEGNFIIWNQTPTGSVNNATFFPSTGDSNGLTFGAVSIINNISVNNKDANGFTQVGNGLFGMRAANLGVVTITGNWLDVGGGSCGISGATSGGNSVTASTSGNTLTITGLSGSFGNNPIEPGWQIFHSGFVTANITAFGTGFGNTGTYTFDGAPQTVGSDSNWTIVPGFTSQALTGNYLLNDPSHTGVPTAIGYSGPTMQATNCF